MPPLVRRRRLLERRLLPVARLRERPVERLLRRERERGLPERRLFFLRDRLLDRLERLLLDLLFGITITSYRDRDRLVRAGTFAPLRRALLNPMAIACLRFLTGCLRERMWCISVRTSCCALRPYLRPREREREVERCDRELRRLEDLRLLAIYTSSLSDAGQGQRVGVRRAWSQVPNQHC
jgi:hypothetical protein